MTANVLDLKSNSGLDPGLDPIYPLRIFYGVTKKLHEYDSSKCVSVPTVIVMVCLRVVKTGYRQGKVI